MGRGSGLPIDRQLGTDQARTRLPSLVDKMRRRRKPSRTLLENAYAIGPRRQGGAVLIPEVDAVAAVERIEQLEAELEDVAVELLLHSRGPEPASETVPLDDVIAEFGLSRHELPRSP